MADHVGVREVDDAEPVAVPDLLDDLVCDLVRRHRGLEVVARDIARARDEGPRLARPRLLTAAVEEVRDVGVLLRLGHVQLAHVVLGEHLRQRACNVLLGECDRCVEVRCIPGHGRDVDAVVEQHAGQLPAAIGAEVEEDHRVAGLDPRRSLDADRLNELICYPTVIRTLHRGKQLTGRNGAGAAFFNDCLKGFLGTLEALVPVHCVVAPDDRGDPVQRQLRQVAHRRGR